MKDTECTAFLKWCLPQLRLRWAGFRKVRSQVCKRLDRRIQALNLSGFDAYKCYLEEYPEEWNHLDSLCRITISRFYRDRGVFDVLRSEILPMLAQNAQEMGEQELRCWSAGCCSGEEAYTLQIIWQIGMEQPKDLSLSLRVIATDIDPDLIERAGTGIYQTSSIRDLPEELIRQAFDHLGEELIIQQRFTKHVEFLRQDIRTQLPRGVFHLILCRNLVFTYFEQSLQAEILGKLINKLVPGGILVIGAHESLPNMTTKMILYNNSTVIYQRICPL